MHKHFVVAVTAALSVAGLTAGNAHASREVVVQPGESMQSISRRYYGDDRHVWEITSFNHLVSPDLIYAGLKLVLPDLVEDGQNLDGSIRLQAGGSPPPATASSSPATGPTDERAAPPLPPGAPGSPPPLFALPVLTTPGSPDAVPRADGRAPVDLLAAGPPIEAGLATWYGPGFNGSRTYCGEIYDQWAYTAASNTLPCGAVVIVTNQNTGASVRVRINDRGGFRYPDILDLSRAAFESIASISAGVAPVSVAMPLR